MEKALRWWWGDWYAFGERKYGEVSSQGEDLSGLSVKSLWNCTWVSNKVETSRRREDLPWAHHEAVAGLEPSEQDRLLDKAEQERLKYHQLRQLVRRERARALPPLPEGIYRTLVVDPPWRCENTASRGAAEGHSGGTYLFASTPIGSLSTALSASPLAQWTYRWLVSSRA
jgi:hypothetical protein